jgi:hypothetical protein
VGLVILDKIVVRSCVKSQVEASDVFDSVGVAGISGSVGGVGSVEAVCFIGVGQAVFSVQGGAIFCLLSGWGSSGLR